MNTGDRLKSLKERKSALENDLLQAQSDLRDAQLRVSALTRELSLINAQIKVCKMPEIVISGHALERYLERVHGLDKETFRLDILPPSTLRIIEEMGRIDGGYGAGSHKVVLKDGVVTTILGNDQEVILRPQSQ